MKLMNWFCEMLNEEEELSLEFNELLVSLPKERGWRTPHLYRYESYWYQEEELKATISFQRHFQAQDGDLILASIPRSGTIWLKALAFAIVNRKSFGVSSGHPLLTDDPHALVPLFEYIVYRNNRIPDLSSLAPPRLFATHVPFSSLPESIKTTSTRIVYLCRNPLDIFVSLWHVIRKLRPEAFGPLPLEEAFDKYCHGFTAFGPCWDHMLGYWNESLERPQKVLFLKYENMQEDIISHVKMLAEFLGFPFSLEEEREGVVQEISRLCSFETMKKSEVNRAPEKSIIHVDMLRKGKVGDWANTLTPLMVEKLSKVVEEKLEGSGLVFK